MTSQSRIRRIGWIAVLALCTGLYLMLHLKVHAVRSDVVRAERQIVSLENAKLLLETEFETRASQQQLANWNRLEFGYRAPSAGQFIENERQLASLGTPRAVGAPEPIRVARNGDADGAPPFPQFVSPLTGKPVDEKIIAPGGQHGRASGSPLGDSGPMRIALGAVAGGGTE
ncbi:hypothetical protein D6851_09850 [Altericroceibacterium spongiae]|uniref:Uncharacterized protein n=1 Tax=Altericroceibacterium spongiae TaxID=2320269 RepID=A0A420EKD9_9SPHN|nr:hypothetical protein [Altericroceibacterium spongiae]RKF21201.1 hypothetical protein D6851_09850 [Altericroceibacterium spongiae]